MTRRNVDPNERETYAKLRVLSDSAALTRRPRHGVHEAAWARGPGRTARSHRRNEPACPEARVRISAVGRMCRRPGKAANTSERGKLKNFLTLLKCKFQQTETFKNGGSDSGKSKVEHGACRNKIYQESLYRPRIILTSTVSSLKTSIFCVVFSPEISIPSLCPGFSSTTEPKTVQHTEMSALKMSEQPPMLSKSEIITTITNSIISTQPKANLSWQL